MIAFIKILMHIVTLIKTVYSLTKGTNMSEKLIEEKVNEFANDSKMFTSIDIANAIKMDGTWISNGDVAYWLRNSFDRVIYTNTIIHVMDGTVNARLYHLLGSDVSEYNDDMRNQKAITYNDFLNKSFDNYILPVATPNVSVIGTGPLGATGSTGVSGMCISSPLNVVVAVKTKTVKVTKNMVQVPKSFVEALGLYPGDEVDYTQFRCGGKTLLQLDGSKVYKDGRVAFSARGFADNGDTFDVSYEKNEGVVKVKF